ncbi:hypothetical protein P3T18_000393 [Paraburkholderia sp. GAS199]|uniref:hypothetical protein n=1 Tax=Paraburkholderia sp. GAS199 TaxID=3035126 RepID=UPI003D1BCEFB
MLAPDTALHPLRFIMLNQDWKVRTCAGVDGEDYATLLDWSQLDEGIVLGDLKMKRQI